MEVSRIQRIAAPIPAAHQLCSPSVGKLRQSIPEGEDCTSLQIRRLSRRLSGCRTSALLLNRPGRIPTFRNHPRT